MFEELWEGPRVNDPRLAHLVQPTALCGDKAYYSFKIIERLQAEEVRAVIPEIGKTIDAQNHADFDREVYRDRNVVERLIGWLKESRRVFSRFEKPAVNFWGMIHVDCIRYYTAKLM